MNLQEKIKRLEQSYALKKEVEVILTCHETTEIFHSTIWGGEELVIYPSDENSICLGILKTPLTCLIALENEPSQKERLILIRDQMYLGFRQDIDVLELAFSYDKVSVKISGYKHR